jgi:hypothetical protein
VLLLACVHELLLRPGNSDRQLARFYPNVTTEPDPGDPLPSLRRFCAEHRSALIELLATRSTQTNEIGRCALLLPVFGMLADEVGPLAHLDVGASAGLTLLLDRFQYRYEPGGEVGDPSPVVLSCGTRGAVPVPREMPAITRRLGLDRTPVDVHDAGQRRWLEACVWPDQVDRFERLRAALEMAQAAEVNVQRGDAVGDTARLAATLAASGHPVVTTTFVLNYLSSGDRTAYLASLDELGGELDLSWVIAESPAAVHELPVPRSADVRERPVLVLVRWRAGRRHVAHLATAHPHGYWLHWT